MIVAIDFTASNGKLHTVEADPSKLNDYQTSILQVGHILEPYAFQRKFAGFGFGGKNKSSTTTEFFILNGKPDPTITSLDELHEEYKKAVAETEMWGPTLFAPILKKIKEYTRKNKHMYYVLLMLTDGCIHDLRETIDQVVEMASEPLSIIIVGIGEADFYGMHFLDCDKGELVDSQGTPAIRDIV